MISAVVLTKNEEKNIVDCIENLSFCDEVIVIDDYSEDKTIEIIKNLKVKKQNYNLKFKIFQRHLNGDFAQQRNFGLEKANAEWVLFIDADERVSEALASEIINYQLSIINFDGFYIKREDYMWGRQLKYGETGNLKLLRLARKNTGAWVGRVHEEWRVKGRIGELKNPLQHLPHQTISEFLQEINFYTDLRVQELYMQGIHVYWSSIIIYPVGKLFMNYFLKKGFLDGIPGFIVAVFMSFHSFLVRAKLWLLE